MEDAGLPNSSADDLKKHVMKVFEEATKDREDIYSKYMFDPIRDYDSLNENAIRTYHVLAADSGLADETKELFKPRPESGILTDVAVYTIIIWAYTYVDKTEAALKVYHRMIAAGVSPTCCTYIILIDSLATHSSFDVSFLGYAKKYFLEMLDKGMKPPSTSYMTVVDAITCCESAEKAREFVEQIQAKGFTPDSYVPHFGEGHLAEAMKGIKLYADLVNKATDKDMKKEFLNWQTKPKGLSSLSVKMIKALIKDGNADDAIKICKRTAEIGMQPTVVIHTCVIEAYLKLGKTKDVLEAYWGMLAAGVTPNSYTYTVLIKGLTADPNFFRDAKKCFLEMMEKGLRPNVATYTAVIESFAKQEDKACEEECKELVEVMISKGFVPNAKAMMEVLKGRPKSLIRGIMNIVLSKLRS
ncbi:PREDICTED: protein Rf1, mitochondrial-like [Fragaria vesca subsp. vesca]|uniref:protein Rf1, mitochondrial-like n=1 Tax=Fragaria vesca subsp. vesca TaxID=101020 RepID=UPI0002C32B94|nr:PREDICTED: protein Rf1, mitochondrial-like [Fragaria vesca subsp. vesca]XP_011457354.1 PREDICTED: protein Rf1, mitochondrial-like [Fragaria vesca subsp. vesca]